MTARVTRLRTLPPVPVSHARRATEQADAWEWHYDDALRNAVRCGDADEALRILRDACEASYELAERQMREA